MRMFERDKNELRAFGVPIETVQSDGDEIGAYRLAGRDFYLPYLRAVAPSGAAQRDPRHVDKFGYRALTTLSFEADELAAVLAAAERVQSLGDPHLALDAESAVRKLSVDLPLGELEGADEVRFVPPREQAARAVFEALGDALTRRKWVSFDYHAMSTDRSERRHVEPYGLFFLGSHWYLAARDRDRGELRNFRLNRISAPEVNATNSLSPDYEIAAGFQLREHARSRQPWEIGEGDSTDSVVEFRDHAGADAPAARLGTLVAGCENRRLFRVRRMDVFARWLLSLQGDAVPMSPDALVREYHDQVRRTLAAYNEAERPKRGPRSAKRGHRTEGGAPA
jgi:Predicted transcriptional regulator